MPASVPVIKSFPVAKEQYPLLDENVLIQALLSEISVENSEKIRSGSVLAIIAAFDRRVPRAAFLDIVATALPLYDWLGSMQTVQRIDMIHKKKKLTEESLATALAEFGAQSDAYRVAILNRMKMVVSCAPSSATIH